VIFTPAPLDGAVVLDLERRTDERGWFSRTFAVEELAAHGLVTDVVHMNASFNDRAGTLRGMHYQAAPHAECKIVRCTRGAVFDVIVDLRPGSDTYTRWFGVELTADNGRSLYVPEGFAHGFQTLEDSTEVLYVMSHHYVPDAARGVRWDDPAFGIDWPAADARVMSERDAGYPDFTW
jgi:dTDP-4-dehydrorhamnose 3,5-epimerase